MINIISKYLFVAYDIENDSKRLQVSNLLQYYGLVRIQYSVFAGEISFSKFKEMHNKLFCMHFEDDDNITIIPVCENCKNNISSLKSLPEHIKHLSI